MFPQGRKSHRPSKSIRTIIFAAAVWLGALLLAFKLAHHATAQGFNQVPLSLPGVAQGAVAWGDFDNDGKLDLLIAGDTGAGLITQLYRNNGGGVFTLMPVALPGIKTGSVVWGD